MPNSTRVFVRQRFFLEQRMRKYLRGRRQIKGFGLCSWPASRLYKELGLLPFHSMPNTGKLRCLEMKMIGKPYAGKPHVRFDEGEQDFVLWKTLNGHDAGNGGYGQGST